MPALCAVATRVSHWPSARPERRAAAAAGACRRWRRHASGGGPERPEQPPSSSGGGSDGAADRPPASGSGGGGGGTSQFHEDAWQLMGRVVQEERVAIAFDRHLNQGLVLSAAARESGLGAEQFEAQLQRLLVVCPFLQQRMVRMRPKLLAALAAHPDRIAARLIELRGLLPGADVAAIAGARPSLLLDPEWAGVPAAVAALARHYSEAEVARLAAAEPLLLVESIDDVLAELQRLLPGQQPREALLAQPSLASNAVRLSNLSLW